MRPVHQRRTTCRGCSAAALSIFLELGPTPLANSLSSSGDEIAPTYPLDVALCSACGLVQLIDVIDAEVLFRDYVYVSGTSDTMQAHFATYANDVADLLSLGPKDLVIEAASNDGTLLRGLARRAIRVLGVEPARNVAALAESNGIPTLAEFFDESRGREIRRAHGPARAFIANNVLAHVDDPVDFLAGARELLTPDGRVFLEFPYLGSLVERLEWDTIYHEHLSYFSATSVAALLRRAGLSALDVLVTSVHGGSIRVTAGLDGEPSRRWSELLKNEAERGLGSLEVLTRFAGRVKENAEALFELVSSCRRRGMRLAAYGAPAKSTTLTSYARIDAHAIEFAVDKAPWKVGRFIPGARIPIRSVETLALERPDLALLFAWNFADEILRQQSAYRAAGGRFVVPIPVPKELP
ncbi:MAG: class I SAM-dependent methyltransferase [Deltaproteobacteria bacterium]|nr:class I SAM-dependent methyltransferase [Deltaproteobacteria bacterium]